MGWIIAIGLVLLFALLARALCCAAGEADERLGLK